MASAEAALPSTPSASSAPDCMHLTSSGDATSAPRPGSPQLRRAAPVSWEARFGGGQVLSRFLRRHVKMRREARLLLAAARLGHTVDGLFEAMGYCHIRQRIFRATIGSVVDDGSQASFSSLPILQFLRLGGERKLVILDDHLKLCIERAKSLAVDIQIIADRHNLLTEELRMAGIDLSELLREKLEFAQHLSRIATELKLFAQGKFSASFVTVRAEIQPPTDGNNAAHPKHTLEAIGLRDAGGCDADKLGGGELRQEKHMAPRSPNLSVDPARSSHGEIMSPLVYASSSAGTEKEKSSAKASPPKKRAKIAGKLRETLELPSSRNILRQSQ